MRKLLLLLTAGVMLAVAGGCMYTAMTSDSTGKVYLTRSNLNGFWNNQWICEPNGGQLNCKEAGFEGSGGGAAAADTQQPAPAPEPAATPAPAEEGTPPATVGGGEGGGVVEGGE